MSIFPHFTDWLSQVATITRGTEYTKADTGQAENRYDAVATDVACQVQVRAGAYVRGDAGYQKLENVTGFFPIGTDLLVGDHVTVAGMARPYVVNAINAPRDSDPDHIEADLVAIEVGD